MNTKKSTTTTMVSLLLVFMLLLSACGNSGDTPYASEPEIAAVESDVVSAVDGQKYLLIRL